MEKSRISKEMEIHGEMDFVKAVYKLKKQVMITEIKGL